jgi:pyruvate ferredoxin oxidoreductase alpha subunit
MSSVDRARWPVLKQTEGSAAVAETVALCRPEVVCAYPISPQTHIVEGLSDLVRDGTLAPCEYVTVESEFAAMSVCIGASAAGARAYTATASQGLLFMAEALYNASGLGLPIVMTVANRAIGSPINIWNDHSDTMSQRDCGWIQLYAETNQEAADLHVQAFRIAEALSMPVMVCMDGFILTHAYERIDVPSREQVDAFLPPFEPRQLLDPADPVTIGAMVGPEAFTEVRYLAHAKQMEALDTIPTVAAEFAAAFGRESGGLIRGYRAEDAETVVVALGSVLGTIEDTIDELREEGVSIGALAIKSFRPFPMEEVRAALAGAKRVVVLEKALAVGVGGIVSANVRMALSGMPLHGYTVIAGLGGRAITKKSLRGLFADALADRLEPLTFLDLDRERVEAELRRMGEDGRSGPHAENILRDIGIVAARSH